MRCGVSSMGIASGSDVGAEGAGAVVVVWVGELVETGMYSLEGWSTGGVSWGLRGGEGGGGGRPMFRRLKRFAKRCSSSSVSSARRLRPAWWRLGEVIVAVRDMALVVGGGEVFRVRLSIFTSSPSRCASSREGYLRN